MVAGLMYDCSHVIAENTLRMDCGSSLTPLDPQPPESERPASMGIWNHYSDELFQQRPEGCTLTSGDRKSVAGLQARFLHHLFHTSSSQPLSDPDNFGFKISFITRNVYSGHMEVR